MALGASEAAKFCLGLLLACIVDVHVKPGAEACFLWPKTSQLGGGVAVSRSGQVPASPSNGGTWTTRVKQKGGLNKLRQKSQNRPTKSISGRVAPIRLDKGTLAPHCRYPGEWLFLGKSTSDPDGTRKPKVQNLGLELRKPQQLSTKTKEETGGYIGGLNKYEKHI